MRDLLMRNLAVAVILAAGITPAAAQVANSPDSLGVMGPDGIIRSEATAATMPLPKPPDTFLPEIILKEQQKVARVLGQPDSCRPSKYGRKCIYRSGQVEITFIDGRADWITYNDPVGVGFFPAAMSMLGVPCPVDVSVINASGGLLTWNGTCPDLHTVVLAPADGHAPGDANNRRLGYVHIKARTP